MLSEEMNLQIEMAGTDRACMMLVCINGCENNMPYGIIVNYHLPCPVSFRGIHGLILALDAVSYTHPLPNPMPSRGEATTIRTMKQPIRRPGDWTYPLRDM